MPHEVIMPALGMAQDTGRIVSWLKQPGEAVASGDALFEVETDKATMEVEATHDGYLTDVRAGAGEDVPVGNAVAMISDTPEDSGMTGSDAGAGADATPDSPDNATLPEGQEVIMPALGMSQDSGTIVAWLVEAGAQVAADDPLFEVETDKSTVEVPAGHAGHVAALLAEAGEEVAVGAAVAVISAEKPAAPVQRKARAAPAETAPAKPARPAPSSLPKKGPAPVAPTAGGRVLASPKARRLAAEQGLDLARLAEAGQPQPYHVKDLEVLRGMEQPRAATPGTGDFPMQITARVPAAPGGDFLAWITAEGATAPHVPVLWAAFACGALRRARDAGNASLMVALTGVAGPARKLADPDLHRLTQQVDAEEATGPALILRDFSDSAITGMRLPAPSAPAVTMGCEGGDLIVTLDFTAAQLDEDQALAFITDFTARLSDPLRHLL